MAEHQLHPDDRTLHGFFSRGYEPVLRIQSGDTILASTLDAGWGLEQIRPDRQRARHPKIADSDEHGHALIGPVWIEGAQPGMTLVVHIEEIVPGSFGYTFAGGWDHPVHTGLKLTEGESDVLVWTLDAQTMIGTNQQGHRLRLKPFLGVMGMPPPEEGLHPTAPPRIWGGNIDCRDLVAGTRLYLPIPVEGGLFSFGDGHAAQGQGEVSVTAIECPMERVRLRLEVLPDLKISTPRAWTPDGWLTLGFGATLEQATFTALDAMLTLMRELYGLPGRGQALGLATALVDLHITQIANPALGVHAFLPHDALMVDTQTSSS